jgi:hypothetical protein
MTLPEIVYHHFNLAACPSEKTGCPLKLPEVTVILVTAVVKVRTGMMS